VDEVQDARRARLRVRLGAVVVLALVALGCAVLASALGNHGNAADLSRTGSPLPSGSGSASTAGPLGGGTQLYVHILGAVQHPGLYALAGGSRVVDVVAAAGGLNDDADQAQVNLARFVVDGEQILVPVIGAVAAAPPGLTAGGKVNINTADETTLETLPRVGPAMASRIIAWRDANGRFTALEDLMSVTGIGQKTFDGFKDLISL
jgi:competence protein ComEA